MTIFNLHPVNSLRLNVKPQAKPVQTDESQEIISRFGEDAINQGALSQATAAIARIQREVRFENREPSITPEPTAHAVHTVVYNPASLDSVYAASQLVASRLGNMECVAHTYLDAIDNLMGKTHLLVCGTELSKETMEVLLTQTDCKVTLFAYRDSYSWLDHAQIKHVKTFVGLMKALFVKKQTYRTAWGDRLSVVRQENDPALGKEYTTSELFLRTDNTATTLAYQWMLENGLNNESTILHEGRVVAMRMASLTFPVLADLSRVGEHPDDPVQRTGRLQQEVVNKAIMHNLLPHLRSALSGVNPTAKIRDIKINTNTDTYMEHRRNVGRQMQRACTKKPYRNGNKVYVADTIACTEMLHYELLTLFGANNKSLVTYEDTHGLRIWRVYATDRSVKLGIVRALKGAETWCEGECLCTYTKIPAEH